MRGLSTPRLAIVADRNDPPLLRIHPPSVRSVPARVAPAPFRVTADNDALPLRQAILLGGDCLRQSLAADAVGTTHQPGGPALQARLLLLLVALGLDEGDRAERLATTLVDSRLETGGWSRTANGAFDVSTSVAAYLAIKLYRGAAACDDLRGARRAIIAAGGAQAVDNETHAWLALFGQAPPRSSESATAWSAALESGIERRFDALHGVREINAIDGESAQPAETRASLSPALALLWRRLSMPSGADNSEVKAVEASIESLIHDDPETGEIDFAPSEASVSHTADAVDSLLAIGFRDDAAGAVAWLVDQSESLCEQTDVIETASALRALGRWRRPVEVGGEALPPALRVFEVDDQTPAPGVDNAVEQLVAHLMKQQHADGSWGSVEATATAIEALLSADHEGELTAAAASHGADWLRGKQLPDGGWQSPTLDRVASTSAAVRALAAVDESEASSEASLAGVNWLLAEQAADGAWGEPSDALASTAVALEAIQAVGATDTGVAGRSVDLLLEAQNESGGWPASVDGLPNDRVRDDLQATSATLRTLASWAAKPRSIQPQKTATNKRPTTCLRVVGGDNVAG